MPERGDVVFEHLLKGERAKPRSGVAIGATAEDESGDPVEDSGKLQGRHHPVHPVDRLIHILQEENGPVKSGKYSDPMIAVSTVRFPPRRGPAARRR